MADAIVDDWQAQLDFTTKIFRARGLHLDDRHVRTAAGESFSASIVDLSSVRREQLSAIDPGWLIDRALPAQDPDRRGSRAVERDAFDAWKIIWVSRRGTIKVYVLVEQLEATFQLMEIRAVLGLTSSGYNTGRWDYINSVADAMAWNAAISSIRISMRSR